MNREQEDAICAVADCTDTLNRCIVQAHEAGLEIKVTIEADCDIRVEIKDEDGKIFE